MIREKQIKLPTSKWHQIPKIISIAYKLKPKSILDIGIGSGKYGLLMKEYVRPDILDGVEAFEPYLGDVQKSIYDNIYVEDITKMDIPKYDLYLLIDVLEHIEKEKGKELLKKLKGRVIVAMPKNIEVDEKLNQERIKDHGNKYGVHVSSWTAKELGGKDYSEKSLVVCI